MTSSSVPPSPRQGERQLNSNGLLRHSHPRHQSQDSLLLCNTAADGGSLLSAYGHPLPRSPRVKSGAASVPSSPRMGRRLYSQGKASGDTRQRKYSTGSLNNLGMHSRSLPRLHNAADPPALSLPSRHSVGSHRGSSAGARRSLSSLEQPPDVTVPASMPSTPRRASLASLSSLGVDMDGTGLDLSFTERRLSFGKGGLGPGQRVGSISSLNGKEELRDYHQHQRDERLREQKVQRLVSFFSETVV